VMLLTSRFTQKEREKEILMFVLLDQVHMAVAYPKQHSVSFIICAYHFENDDDRIECVMCRGCSLPSPVESSSY
jgi:hypothetical protein